MPTSSPTPPTNRTDRASEPDDRLDSAPDPGRRTKGHRRQLRLVASDGVALPRTRRRRPRHEPADEAGTTTAEYTVVTAAAVAFGALLLKLLTGSWGTRILDTAFQHVIALLT